MQPFFTNVVASEPFNSFCVARGSARLSSATPSLKGPPWSESYACWLGAQAWRPTLEMGCALTRAGLPSKG
jgi:hypothetical protein